MVAVLIGSSGLVGSHILHQLCEQPAFTKVVLLVRRASGFQHPKVSEVIVNFDHLDNYKEYIKGDVMFSCIGSTRAKTPNLKSYYLVDYQYSVKLAWIAVENKVHQLHFISAIGAKEKSSNFYLKMKGETEVNISVMKFQSTHIYRPSVLSGKRTENRPLEKLSLAMMTIVSPFLLGSLKKYKPIKATDLARAIITQSLKNLNGTFYYESDKIQAIADGKA